MKFKKLWNYINKLEIILGLNGKQLMTGIAPEQIAISYGEYEVMDTYFSADGKLGIELRPKGTTKEQKHDEMVRGMCEDFVKYARDAVMDFDAGREEEALKNIAKMSALHCHCIGTMVSNIVSGHGR